MDTAQFWRLIERSKAESGGDCDRQVEALTDALLKLPEAEIEEFNDLFGHFFSLAYRHDLWGAAYIMRGGCSSDAFMDFRSWLIGQGEAVFAAALRDPESLAKLVERREGAADDYECQYLAYAALDAYERKMGREMSERPESDDREPASNTQREPWEPQGEPWEEDDLPTLFPKLCAACDW
jgi:uncharacterized protein DUF4240